MKKSAIILAAGSGTRAGGDIPKQFRIVAGRPVIWWSVRAFLEADPDTKIILTLSQYGETIWNTFERNLPFESRLSNYAVAYGGASRWESVRNSLFFCPDEGLIAVHDAARPMITPDMVRRGWTEAEQSGATVPVVPLTDSIRKIIADDKSEPEDRSRFLAVQTPQIFKANILKDAYMRPELPTFTDDASVVESAGFSVSLYNGDSENIKITHPQDFILADYILSHR